MKWTYQGFILLFACILGKIHAETAESFTYPVQEFLLAIGNTNRNINTSATSENLTSAKISGERTEKWYLHYVSAGVYEIVSSPTGYVVTDDNGSIKVAPDVNGANQRWQFVGVENDYDGYVLYYKIVSNANTSKALTFVAAENSFKLDNYAGDNLQKFKVNLNGLEGFAANGVMENGKEKAGTIGGLFGETVIVTDVSSLKTALASTDPKTIVINGVFDMRNEAHTRIRDNKTIIGSYNAKTLQDCFLRTNNEYGTVGDNPSDNIVFRNIDFQAVNVEDRILVNIWSSRQIWFDHCTFNSKLTRAVDEVGKFIWINTPYLNYMDAKDNGRSPDYITISYCTFTNRFWTVAYGTQNSETRRDRTTLMYNKWDQCVRRTPQLGNGIAHVYNNLYLGNDNGNDQSTSQIIAGDGSEFLSQYCRFQSLTGKEIAGGTSFPYRDVGSYTATTSTALPQLLNFASKTPSTWKPETVNYGYTLVAAYNQDNTDIKAFCQNYAGAFSTYAKIKYINDPALSAYVSVTYPTPFLKDIEVGSGKVATVMDTTHAYVIRNVNSSLTLGLPGNATSGTGVIQTKLAQTWKLRLATNGYYRVYTSTTDSDTAYLGISGASKDNGANVALQTNASSSGLLFKFVANADGSYLLTTQATADQSCVGVAAGSTVESASVVQWSCNQSSDQNWTLHIAVPTLTGNLIQELNVLDTMNYKGWNIVSKIAVGDSIYGDRSVTFAELPQVLVGAEAIRTACDSKNSTADLASFVSDTALVAYVAMDQRVASVPTWLSTWKKTNLTVKSSSDVLFDVYELSVDSGATVALGTNGQANGAVNYVVFVIPNSQGNTVANKGLLLSSIPNFSFHQGTLLFSAPLVYPVTISLYHINGVRARAPISVLPGVTAIPLGSNMPRGVYFVSIEGAGAELAKMRSVIHY